MYSTSNSAGRTQRLSDGLYLAFDGSCSVCKGISTQVESVTRGKLSAVPLMRESVQIAREQVFGEDPPFEPTLIKVVEGAPSCWIGKHMAAVLLRELGPLKTMNVLQALGAARGRGSRRFSHPELARMVSRRGLGQLIGGALAAAGILSGGGLAGVATAAGPEEAVPSSDPDADLARFVEDPDILAVAPRDFMEALQTASIKKIPELDSPALFVQVSGEGSTEFDSVTVPGYGFLGVFAVRTFSDGVRQRLIGISPSEEELVVLTVEEGGSVTGSIAEYYRMNATEGYLEMMAASSNGVHSSPPDESSDSVTDGGVSTQASDPCGGCASMANSTLSPSCKTTGPVGCALGLGGCALCAPACAASITRACIGCVVTGCGGAVLSCCGKDSSKKVCRPCNIVP